MDFNQAREKRLKILRNQYIKLVAARRRTNWGEDRKVKCAINPKNYNPKKPEETYALDYYNGSKLVWLSELECIKRGEEIIEEASSIKNHHINKPWSKQDLVDDYLNNRSFGALIGSYQIDNGKVKLDHVEDQYYPNIENHPHDQTSNRGEHHGHQDWCAGRRMPRFASVEDRLPGF